MRAGVPGATCQIRAGRTRGKLAGARERRRRARGIARRTARSSGDPSSVTASAVGSSSVARPPDTALRFGGGDPGSFPDRRDPPRNRGGTGPFGGRHRGEHAGVRGGWPGEEGQTGARCRPGGHRGPPLPKNDGLVGRRGRGDRTDIADVRDRRRVGHPRCVRPAARATRRALACGPNLLIDDQSVGGLDAVAAGRGRPPCRPAVYGGARTVIDGPSIVALRNATGIGTAAQEDSSGSTRAASIGSGPRACFT